MNIEKLLQDLSSALGVPNLQLDDQHACALVFDDDLHTELRYDERADVLCLYAEVGRARPGNRHQLTLDLLAANAGDAQGSHFAITPVQEEVVLCRTLDADDPGADRLLKVIEDLVTSSRRWRGQLEGAGSVVQWNEAFSGAAA